MAFKLRIRNPGGCAGAKAGEASQTDGREIGYLQPAPHRSWEPQRYRVETRRGRRAQDTAVRVAIVAMQDPSSARVGIVERDALTPSIARIQIRRGQIPEKVGVIVFRIYQRESAEEILPVRQAAVDFHRNIGRRGALAGTGEEVVCDSGRGRIGVILEQVHADWVPEVCGNLAAWEGLPSAAGIDRAGVVHGPNLAEVSLLHADCRN